MKLPVKFWPSTIQIVINDKSGDDMEIYGLPFSFQWSAVFLHRKYLPVYASVQAACHQERSISEKLKLRVVRWGNLVGNNISGALQKGLDCGRFGWSQTFQYFIIHTIARRP